MTCAQSRLEASVRTKGGIKKGYVILSEAKNLLLT